MTAATATNGKTNATLDETAEKVSPTRTVWTVVRTYPIPPKPLGPWRPPTLESLQVNPEKVYEGHPCRNCGCRVRWRCDSHCVDCGRRRDRDRMAERRRNNPNFRLQEMMARGQRYRNAQLIEYSREPGWEDLARDLHAPLPVSSRDTMDNPNPELRYKVDRSKWSRAPRPDDA